MADIEKVIKGLRFCFDETLGIVSCDGCVYSDSKTFKNGVTHCYLVDDVISLLKEQQETLRKQQDGIDKQCLELSTLRHRLNDQPQIVRCKDCKFMIEDDVFQCGIKAGYFPVNEEWFCADGQPKSTT